MQLLLRKLGFPVILLGISTLAACGVEPIQSPAPENMATPPSESESPVALVELSACRSIGRSADAENYCVDSVELANVEPGKKYYYWMKLSPSATTDVKNVQIRFLDGNNPAETVTFEVGDSKSGHTWRPYIVDKDCKCSIDVVVETDTGPQVVIDSAPVASAYEDDDKEDEAEETESEEEETSPPSEGTDPEVVVDPGPVETTDDTPSPFEEALQDEDENEEETDPEEEDDPESVLDDYLLAWYPLNGDTNDHSGNGHHAAPAGGLYSADRIGRSSSAYTLDGNEDVLDLGIEVANQSVRSFSLWFKTSTDRYAQTILGNYVSCSYSTMGFIVQNWGSTSPLGSKLELRNGQGRNPVSNIGYAGNYHDGSWHHLAVVFDATSFQLYIDNVMVAAATGTYEPTIHSLLVGGASTLCGKDTHLDGSIDDLRIYSIALDAEQVSSLYNQIDP